MDDEQLNEKIDWFGPEIIAAFITALMGDLLFLFILPHYFCGIIAFSIVVPKVFRKISNTILKVNVGIVASLVFILPLPLLTLTIFGVLLLTNSFIEKLIIEVVEQAAIQTIAVATAGAGEALEGVAVVAEGGEIVAEAGGVAEAAEAATEVSAASAEAAEIGEAGAETGEKTVESGRPSEQNTERDVNKNEKPSEREIENRRPNLNQDEQEQGEDQPDQDQTTYENLIEESAPAEREPNKQLKKELFPEEGFQNQSKKPSGPQVVQSKFKANDGEKRLNERLKRIQQTNEQLRRFKQPSASEDELKQSDKEDQPMAA